MGGRSNNIKDVSEIIRNYAINYLIKSIINTILNMNIPILFKWFFLNLSPKDKNYLILSMFNKTSISDIRGLLLNCLSKLFNVHTVCWYCLWLSLHGLQISPYLLKTPCTSDTKIREPWAVSDLNGPCLRTSFCNTRSAIWTSKGWDNQQPNPAMTPVNLNNQDNTTNIRG